MRRCTLHTLSLTSFSYLKNFQILTFNCKCYLLCVMFWFLFSSFQTKAMSYIYSFRDETESPLTHVEAPNQRAIMIRNGGAACLVSVDDSYLCMKSHVKLVWERCWIHTFFLSPRIALSGVVNICTRSAWAASRYSGIHSISRWKCAWSLFGQIWTIQDRRIRWNQIAAAQCGWEHSIGCVSPVNAQNLKSVLI